MGHSSCAQEMQDFKQFLLKILPDGPKAVAMTTEQIEKLSAKELKLFIVSQGGSTVGLLEKPELVAKALSFIS